jgi:hypothetical protein
MLRGLVVRRVRMSHGGLIQCKPANTNRTYMTDRTYMVPISALRDNASRKRFHTPKTHRSYRSHKSYSDPAPACYFRLCARTYFPPTSS